MLKMLLKSALVLGLLSGLPAKAIAEDAHWALTLAWSPQYCKSFGNPLEPQCIDSALFVASALVSQQNDGRACNQPLPLTDSQVDRLISVTQNARQVRDLWRTTGACAGLPFEEFATQFDYASRRINIPQAYTEITRRLVVPASAIRQQFLDANSGMPEEGIALHCKNGELVDISFCLTQKMKFAQCGARVVDDCGSRKILLRAPSR